MELADDIPDNCLPVSAKDLGLANAAFTPLNVPSPGEVELLEASVRYKALIHADILSDQLVKVAGASTATISQKQSAAEFFVKLARMDQKKQDVSPHGQGYQLVINIGGTPETFRGLQEPQTVVIDQVATVVEDNQGA